MSSRRRPGNHPGHAHELTFCGYRRLPLLKSPSVAKLFKDNMARAAAKLDFEVRAYVIMPNHVHILVKPRQEIYAVASILHALKQPIAKALIGKWKVNDPRKLMALRDISPQGKLVHRFWQAGWGYDRNLYGTKAMWAAIEYIHANPVRRGLCEQATDWPFSSATAYAEGDDPSGLVTLYSDWS